MWKKTVIGLFAVVTLVLAVGLVAFLIAEALTAGVGKKVLVAITGLMLFGFVIVHLLGNLTLFIPDGGKAFNEYAHFLENLLHVRSRPENAPDRTGEPRGVLLEELREALRRKARSLKEAQQVRARAAEQATTADAMKGQLEQIEAKLDDLKARQKTLAAQVRQARTQPAAPDTTASDRLGGGAFSDLERMADHIDQLDAEVEAHHLLEDPKRTELDARFRELESEQGDDGIEDELASLKAKLGG